MRIRRIGLNGIAGLSAILLSCGIGNVEAQAPAKTKLKKILVLDKSQFGANGHMESRRDFNAALASLSIGKGFTVTTIGQNDPASTIAAEFSAAGLANYQVVVFSNNDGVHAQLTPAAYALPMPARGGIYFVVARAGGRTTRHRVTIL